MINRIADISLRRAAMIAGLGLLIMTIFSLFAYFIVFPSLIVPGDAAVTANNIVANEGLFRIGICSFIVVIICDVVVAWALYILLKPVHKSLSLLTAWFRLLYATIFGIALGNYFSVLHILNDADYSTAFDKGQLHAQVMLSLNSFRNEWDIGYVFFGLHLFVLGYLVFKSVDILFKSATAPKVLGVLLIIASFGYLIDTFGKFFSPNYDANIALFTFFGEALFMLWLLWSGAKGFDGELGKK